MKRVISVAIVLMAITTLAWAQPPAETGSSTGEAVKLLPKSWETLKDQPATISAFWDPPREFGDVNTDALVPTVMREQTGVRLDVKTAIDNTEQSLNLLIASGSLADFMYINYERPAARNLVESDLLYSYDELYETYGVQLINRLNANQRFVQRTTFGTKDIYYLNQAGVPPDKMDDPWVVKYQTGIFVNRFYYDKIGAPPIKSMDDFIAAAQKAVRPAYFAEAGGFASCPIYDRYRLAVADVVCGPAIIEEADSTTVVHPGYRATVNRYGNLILTAGTTTAVR